MHMLTVPAGGRAKVHYHESHETAIYALSGSAVMWHGEQLEHRMDIPDGGFVFIPPGVPHLPANLSSAEPFVAILARTDPNEHERVILCPELEQRADELIRS
jgi:uncharacterized RmlC-like cupin family protein